MSSHAKKNEEIARKWRALIQKRREHLTELYRSGRYKKYFTEQALLHQMREAVAAADGWDAVLARRPDDSLVEHAVRALERDRAA